MAQVSIRGVITGGANLSLSPHVSHGTAAGVSSLQYTWGVKHATPVNTQWFVAHNNLQGTSQMTGNILLKHSTLECGVGWLDAK